MNTLQEMALINLQSALRIAEAAGVEIVDDAEIGYKITAIEWNKKLGKAVAKFDEVEKSDKEKALMEFEERAEAFREHQN